MQISNNYVLVERVEKEQTGDFQLVEVQDDFVYRGRVIGVPEAPIYLGNKQVGVGDIVLFAKYSPDTHEIDLDGRKVKFVAVSDLLACE